MTISPITAPNSPEPEVAADKAPNLTLVAPAAPPAPSPWWRIADFGVLGVWIAIVGFTLRYHEKWCDEAQAWLFARDLSLRTLWFHELRYEGSPGLWHTILWIAQHIFHLRYDSIGLIGMAGATAGVALLIFKAPFPRYIRWPLAFTYFMVYQYAVIARQYTLLPLLTFTVALLFKDLQKPARLTAVLVLLALTSFHGTVLAACLGVSYLIDARRYWSQLDRHVRTRYWICVAAMVLTFAFVYVVLKPAPDSRELAYKRGLLTLPANVNQRGEDITPTVRLSSVISGAYLDYVAPSVLFLLLAGLWCFLRGRLLVFALAVGSQLVLYSLLYGSAHHQGSAFVAAIAVLWIAWPSAAEKQRLASHESWALSGITVLLLCLCAVNIWDSAVVIKREYLYPYSGAEDAANYLRTVGAERGRIFGYGFSISAIQAYFDHKIVANLPTSFTHNSVSFPGFWFDENEFQRDNPEYVVLDSRNPQATLTNDIPTVTRFGYEVVHFSDGYYLYKTSVYEREAFFILRRVR